MKIHQKIAKIQNKLMMTKLPKSGFNKFGKFHYHELEDILPPIFQECYKENLFLEFSFTSELAQLKVREWENNEGMVITSVPVPPITQLNKGMNVMQSEGSYITCLKRYLLSNLFLIMERDVVDSDGSKPEPPKEVVAADNAVQKIREYIHKKDKSLDITPEMINNNRMKLFKKGELSKAENKEVFDWYNKVKSEAKI